MKMSSVSTDNPILTQDNASGGWYVLDQHCNFNKRISIQDGETVNLIITEYLALNANKGIDVPAGATLHIWGQSDPLLPTAATGVINSFAQENGDPDIGGNGYLYIHGGVICAIGGTHAAGIKGKSVNGQGNYGLYIYGGAVVSIGGEHGAGIGCGFSQVCGGIKITGGQIYAKGNYRAAGIGAGYHSWTCTPPSGSFSGNPSDDEFAEIRITGGNVTAIGGTGAGIGGGQAWDDWEGTPAIVYIDGGTVNASTESGQPTNSEGAVAIGKGDKGMDVFDYLHIYDGAKVSASTSNNGGLTLQNAADGRSNDNYITFKQMKIEPCDHPNLVSNNYTDNNGNLLIGCDYCYTTVPYALVLEGNWNENISWRGQIQPQVGSDVEVRVPATIPSGCIANVGNITLGELGSITIADGGQLLHTNAGVQATVQKSITGHGGNNNGGWNFIASPLTESFAPTAGNGFLTNTYDLYFYDEPTHYWRNYKPGNQASGFSIEPQQGYLYANSGGTMLQFNGTLQPNTEVTIGNLSQSASTLTGFNLVGNPFAHNVTTYTGTSVSAECFRLNDTRSEVVVGTIDAEHPLLPAEGFFVKATGADASITFNAQTRGTAVTPARISLELVEGSPSTGSGTALIDRLIVKREGEPLEKLTIRDGGTRLFALRNSQEMAVVIAEGNEQPVSFKAAKNGTYTLTIQVEGMELGYLHLIDNLTGNDVDLLQTPSYTFESNANDYDSRFRLVFTADEDNLDNTDNFAFVSDGNIIIKSGPSTSSGTLQIVDVTGRIVATHSGRIQCVPTSGMTPGVYVLRLIQGDKVRMQKIVVR